MGDELREALAGLANCFTDEGRLNSDRWWVKRKVEIARHALAASAPAGGATGERVTSAPFSHIPTCLDCTSAAGMWVAWPCPEASDADRSAPADAREVERERGLDAYTRGVVAYYAKRSASLTPEERLQAIATLVDPFDRLVPALDAAASPESDEPAPARAEDGWKAPPLTLDIYEARFEIDDRGDLVVRDRGEGIFRFSPSNIVELTRWLVSHGYAAPPPAGDKAEG